MKPNKPGKVAKFHIPLTGENTDQLYIVSEMKALNTELSFPPINTVLLDDLEVVEVDTYDLVGHEVTINKADYSQTAGKVVKVNKKKIMLDLTKGIKCVETNVWLPIKDEDVKEHTGNLFVN